jgi:hypothetical protein
MPTKEGNMVHVVLALALSTAHAADPERHIQLNGHAATKADLDVLATYEKVWGVQVPSGAYWYDGISGATGQWGGPTRGFLAPGLALGGGKVPAEASGGGKGTLTGVFINGREIHPLDVQGLTMMMGTPPWPGRWTVDAQGWFGLEGGSPVGNLMALAAQRNHGGGNSYYKSDVGTGSSTFVGSGCAAVSGRTNPSSSSSDTYSYYVGCD